MTPASPTPDVAERARRELSAAELAGAILALEARVNLEAAHWRSRDIHWWPLYRNALYIDGFVANVSSAGVAGPRARLRPANRRSFDGLKHSVGAVWLVSDGVSFARLDGVDVDRFCEPIRAQCAALGVSAHVIDRTSMQPRNTTTPMAWWAPWLHRQKIACLLHERLLPDPRHAAIAAELRHAAQGTVFESLAISPLRFGAMARTIESVARRLTVRMRADRVRAVFITSYYDVLGYAFALAAARAGIPAVDIQHGLTGRYHMAYADWPTRNGDFALLPTWYWTWTDADAAIIHAWSNGDLWRHRAICGGHPYMDAWRRGQWAVSSSTQGTLDRLLEAAGDGLRVLVTLQAYLSHRAALEPLLDAMRDAPDVRWWLRLHPAALTERDALVALLAAEGIDNVELDDTTSLPLPVLLRHVQVHATHSSSTVIEARAAGVPSILWSTYGMELAGDLIAEGWAIHAPTGQAILNSLACLSGTAAEVAATDSDHGTAAIKQILGHSE